MRGGFNFFEYINIQAYNFQMFEDKTSANNYQITRNEKQNSNKLKAYFQNSSFLVQQQQLATFIKNLPIIKIDDMKSINKLIQMLIKQNEMIGSKCQQNFITIKECYAKHDELIRKNRNTQNQLLEANRVIERNGVNNQHKAEFQEQLSKMKEHLAEKVDFIKQISQQCNQLNEQNVYYHESVQHLSEVIKIISERNFKKGLEKIKEFNKKSNQNQMGWIDWDQLETYIKDQKKKLKYFPKIKETVELFCGRFLKISQYVNISQVRDEFLREVSNLMEILDELLNLKKKNNLLSSQSRMTVSGADYNFFEGLLDKVLRARQNDTITKEDITHQLQDVKQQLASSKKHYEQYLAKIKTEYQTTMRKLQDEVQQKDHMLQFYEGEKQTITKDMMQMKNRIIQFEETIKAERYLSKNQQEDFQNLEIKLESVKSQYATKEKQLKQQWEQNIKTYQYKLTQKQELVQEEQKIRKSLRQELQEKTVQFKLKLQENQEQIKHLNQSLKDINNKNNHLALSLQNLTKKSNQDKLFLQKQLMDKAHRCQQMARRLQKDMTEIKHFQQQIQQCEKQKNLQSAYIKQLQSKSGQLLIKIKTIQSKKSDEKTAKKEINAIKQTILEEKKISREIQENYTAQKQENQRLKTIIKQMKKELQEVYLQFNHLKMIESDRQKLISEIEKSDRVKQQLYQQYEHMKMDLLKLDQENKTLAIQVKHYKNALLRIQALR